MSFWYLSIVGSTLLFAYAIYRQDPVFIAGQAFGSIVYLRNLQLIAKQPTPEGIDHALKPCRPGSNAWA